jgi:GNAT superfamily N-acetyltransferase
MAPISIRTALAHELPLVLSIDDDATKRYALGGVVLGVTDEHPFVKAEQRRWAAALAAGDVFFAERDGRAIGVAVMEVVDGAAYLDQLSVRMDEMNRGVGRALIARAMEWARGRDLWLTTYGHLEWNRPYYERGGFAVVPEPEWGPGIRAIVEEQREALPHPELRVAMRHPAR